MPVITSTSGRLHSECVRLLFLQSHRETDFFLPTSGVLSVQSDRGLTLLLRWSEKDGGSGRIHDLIKTSVSSNPVQTVFSSFLSGKHKMIPHWDR